MKTASVRAVDDEAAALRRFHPVQVRSQAAALGRPGGGRR
jgi:hypothetical protein